MTSEKLFNFINFNLELSGYYTQFHVFERLLMFLQQRRKHRRLLLDKYHYEVIQSCQDILMGDINSYFPKYEIIDDQYYSLSKINDGDDILLYNLSIYFTQTDRFEISENNGIVNFYRSKDKILTQFTQNSKFENLKSSSRDILMNSYEHKKSLGINEFFDEYF